MPNSIVVADLGGSHICEGDARYLKTDQPQLKFNPKDPIRLTARVVSSISATTTVKGNRCKESSYGRTRISTTPPSALRHFRFATHPSQAEADVRTDAGELLGPHRASPPQDPTCSSPGSLIETPPLDLTCGAGNGMRCMFSPFTTAMMGHEQMEF